MTARRAAVLGDPVGHSLSPALHRAAYAELGFDWRYDAHRVGERQLPGFLAGLDDSWAGLSLTMPLKRVGLELADTATPLARTVGAVNTLVLRNGRRHGDNTDVPGMVSALAERGVAAARTGTLVGGGATAASALAALHALGAVQVTLVVRRPGAAGELQALAGRLGMALTVRPWEAAAESLGADLVVQTTPGHAAATLAAAVPERPGALFEVVYDPWPTQLVASWQRRDGVVVSGLDLLIHQAVLQVALMTARNADPARLVPVMRMAGERELAARAAG